MIVTENGWLVIDFDDRTASMMALADVLSKLPARPGMPADLLHSYPVGIERLREAGGDAAVALDARGACLARALAPGQP